MNRKYYYIYLIDGDKKELLAKVKSKGLCVSTFTLYKDIYKNQDVKIVME